MASTTLKSSLESSKHIMQNDVSTPKTHHGVWLLKLLEEFFDSYRMVLARGGVSYGSPSPGTPLGMQEDGIKPGKNWGDRTRA